MPKKTYSSLVDQYLHRIDWQVSENANSNYSLQGLRNYLASEITKDYWLNNLYSKEVAKAHINRDLHIHDLSELNAYCVGWDLQDLLRKGFGGVPGKVNSLPAKHLSTALGQINNFFYTLQGETAGAQALSNFDTLLAPFIRFDELDYKMVKQELQQFVFNLAVPTRVGFQTPFTNVTMDLECPKHLEDESIIIGGEYKSEKYGDFQEEMDMFNYAFAEVMLEGDAQGRLFTFPIPTYNITKDFNWENPKLRPIWEMTAKYGIPSFSNYINSDNDPADTRSMCCRLRLDNTVLNKRLGGIFSSAPLTGSIGVVTLNLPRIGFVSETLDQIYTKIENLMDIAAQSLEKKRELVEKYMQDGLYPYARVYLDSIKQKTGQYWTNHFSTIGLVGMNELLINFNGSNIADPEGQKIAINILRLMKDKIYKIQQETGNLYNLEATPAEATGYRMALDDVLRYPDIIVANQEAYKKGAAPYYSNSTHLPVGYTTDIYEALDLQDKLQVEYTGGTVFHGFLGEKLDDWRQAKILVKKICENYHLPNFTLTPTFSICQEHGYLSGEQKECSICHKHCEVYSRVVGYIRPVDQWNSGKQSEFIDRLEYTQKKEVKLKTT